MKDKNTQDSPESGRTISLFSKSFYLHPIHYAATTTMRTGLFLALLFLLGSNTLLGQDNEIRRRILAHPGGQNLVISKGRLLVADLITERQYQRASEVFDYIERSTDYSQYVAFTYEERLLILALLQRPDEFLQFIHRYDPEKYHHHPHRFRYFNTTEDNRIYPQEDGIYERLVEYGKNMQAIIEAQSQAMLQSDEQKIAYSLALHQTLVHPGNHSFMYPYMVHMGYHVDQCERAAEAATFTAKYPDSPYRPYINIFLYTPLEPAPIGFGFDLGLFTGVGTFNGSLGEVLHQNVAIQLGLDVAYHRLVAQMRLEGVLTSLRRDITVDGIDWFRGENVSYTSPSIDIGYKLYAGHLIITPFAGVSLNTITHDNLDEVPELENAGTATVGGWQYGINLDYAPVKPVLTGLYPRDTYFFARLRLVVKDPQLEKDMPQLDGSMWSLSLSLGAFNRPNRPVVPLP